MNEEKKYLTTREATNFCDCSRRSLERARKNGLLHPTRACKLRYSRAELEAWLSGKLTIDESKPNEE